MVQRYTPSAPWTSATRRGSTPARRCSRSMFCVASLTFGNCLQGQAVTTNKTRERGTGEETNCMMRAMARCPALGTACAHSSVSWARSQKSVHHAAGSAMNFLLVPHCGKKRETTSINNEQQKEESRARGDHRLRTQSCSRGRRCRCGTCGCPTRPRRLRP